MSVVTSSANRFRPLANPSVSAEAQRVHTARVIIPNHVPTPLDHPDNEDFTKYPDRRGTFTKGLPHDPISGLVDPAAATAFVAALAAPAPDKFAALEGLVAAGHHEAGLRPWVNPVGGAGFNVAGGDLQQYVMPPAPAFGSAELTFEMVENFWMAHLRDVPFEDYPTHPTAIAAAAELTTLHTAAVAERVGKGLPATPLARVDAVGTITPDLLFRGLGPGEEKGPYVSQFLLLPVPFGAQGYEQRNTTYQAGTDYVTTFAEWVSVQNGEPQGKPTTEAPRLLRNGRDLGAWVHIDVLFQAYFNAVLILLQDAGAASPVGGGQGVPFSTHNPYNSAQAQAPFATFGPPAHAAMVCAVAELALKAVWFQKWYVHLRMRPEVYAGRIERDRLTGGTAFGLPTALTGSGAVTRAITDHGTALLPLAFPEGSPMHPSYGAGHATVAGACVTVLKALFDGSWPISAPRRVAIGGGGVDSLAPFGGTLTVEGELNKLASNIALGRNIAGVHWRSDGTESLRLGEAVAKDYLRAYARSYAEVHGTEVVFEFNGFDGKPVHIDRASPLEEILPRISGVVDGVAPGLKF